MAIIRVQNPVPNVRENPKTYLTDGVNAGDTSIAVASVSGFNSSTYLQFGDTGVEQTELALNSSVSASPITVAALKYAHPASTPVYEMRYNQMKVYRLRSSVETLIATIDLQPGAPYTVYRDNATVGGDAFATSFYNSNTGDETPKTDYVEVTGYAYNSKRGLIIRAQQLYDDLDERSVKSIMWENWLNEGYSDLQKAVEQKDQGFNLKTVTNSTPTDLDDQTGTSFALETDFRSMKNLWVQYSGGSYVEARPEDVDQATPNTSYSASLPYWSYDGNNVIVRPYQAQAIKYRYYPVLSRLTKDGDVPANPVSYYDDALIDYMLLRASQRKTDKLMIPVYLNSYQGKKMNMQKEVAGRNKGRQQGVQISTPWAETKDANSYI